MKKQKKEKIKRLYKKSIWPSIALFAFFIGSCAVMPASFAGIFKRYLLDSQMTGIYESARQAGRLVMARMEEGGIFEAADFLEVYLGEENDICITDEYGHILRKSGRTAPDFRRMQTVKLIDEYTYLPDFEEGKADQKNALEMSSGEFLMRCMQTLPQSYDKDRKWLENRIFHEFYWVEIPVRADGFRLYYRDDVTLLQRHVYFMTMSVMIEAAFLTVPIIMLFVNVLSSIGMQKRMVNLLYLDSDTGGNNWTYFQQRCRRILGQLWNAGHTYAVVNLHMYRYGDYCTCHGSREGKELLENIYAYLQVNMEYGETFARAAKADFGILMRCDCAQQSEKRLKKLLAELTGIQKERGLSFCAGLYMITPQESRKSHEVKRRKQLDIDQLYHYASAARGSVRGRKGQYIKVFDSQILEEQRWKARVEEMMEKALASQEFQLYLQPKYDPVTEKIVGAEALVRWLSPEDGMIGPDRFIPIFEENGFITKLDEYMVSAVAKLKSEWKIQGKKSVPVSVNISRANFARSDLANRICHLVDGYGAEHEGIELELTESAFFGDKSMLQKILKELKMYGFCISMDDFGTGYSSLNLLKDLPIDVLKLDMDFFKGQDSGGRSEIVVKETIRLAKKLDMKIVAEGIEKKEQVEFLAGQGCDMIQGFYFAKPMTVSDFEKKMQQEG